MKTQNFSRLRPDYFVFLSAATVAAVGIYWLLDSSAALLSGDAETHWVQALLPDNGALSQRLLVAGAVVAMVAVSAPLYAIYRHLVRPLAGLSTSASSAKTARPGVVKAPRPRAVTVTKEKAMGDDSMCREASKHKVVVDSIEVAEHLLRQATAPMLIVLSPHAAGREHLPKIRRLSAAALRKSCVVITDESDPR